MIQTIAVLITCHNRKDRTIGCLKALYNCHLPQDYFFDVYLVDDGSTDGTSEVIQANYPLVNLIKGNGDLYWNQGMRLAWKTAISKQDYSFYLWLNDDTFLYENALSLMLEHSKNMLDKRIIVGATCSAVTGDSTYGGYILPDKEVFLNGNWQDCTFFNGNIVLIPSYIFRQVGLLDNHFHHSLGDIDYGMRAFKMGFIHSLSPSYLGTCEDHESAPMWRNPDVPLIKRLKHFYSPLGNNPFEFFIFERRQNGLRLATIRFFSTHLRSILPQLWKRKT